MLKSTRAYFDTDKLYLVKPSIVKVNSKSIILEQNIDNIDIAFVNDDMATGLIQKRMYEPYMEGNINEKSSYFGVFEEDVDLLVEYLFKTHIGVEPTTEMIKGLFRNKPYYEIDELIDLHQKITKILTEFDNKTKVKKLIKF